MAEFSVKFISVAVYHTKNLYVRGICLYVLFYDKIEEGIQQTFFRDKELD